MEKEELNIEELNKKLKIAGKIVNPIDRGMLVAAIITTIAKNLDIKIIVVGGFASQFYSGGVYQTLDIDISIETGKSKELFQKLKEMGFKIKGRIIEHDEIPIPIDIVGDFEGSTQHIRKYEVEEMPVYVIGVEDLIIDRLCACKYWESLSDCRQAEWIYDVQKESIDEKYLLKRSREEEVEELLSKIMK